MSTKRKTASGTKTEAVYITTSEMNRMLFPEVMQDDWLKYTDLCCCLSRLVDG